VIETAGTSRRVGKRSGFIGKPGVATRTISTMMAMDSRVNSTRGSICLDGSEGEALRHVMKNSAVRKPTIHFQVFASIA